MFARTHWGALASGGGALEGRAAPAGPARMTTSTATATATRTVRERTAHRRLLFTGLLPGPQKNDVTGLTMLRNAAVGTLTVSHERLRSRHASAYTLR